ncbi:MFS drug efflux pump [Pleurostoma richardsiae]|uniref:MFS drug efflux pump n=1 Tax=Pleurostoma richardsiae TaxID=41990 RepID=A0AA38VYJ6_9PEZI|nr:MFS drug efflux pump [Pleurostoma richardsiae]
MATKQPHLDGSDGDLSGGSQGLTQEHGPALEGEKEKIEETREEVVLHEIKTIPAAIDYFRSNEPNAYNGDDEYDSSEDEPLEIKMTWRRGFSFLAMAMLWVSGQIPLYLFGAIPVIIYADIGGEEYWVWFIIAYLLTAAAVLPFVGAFTDLVGRRTAAIIGCILIIAGQLVVAAADDMPAFISGMGISGFGAGINELTALCGTSELVPTSQRGYYISGLMLAITPFIPSVLYAQLIATSGLHHWRYLALLCGFWTLVGLAILVIAYHPPPRRRNLRREELRRRSRDYSAAGLELQAVPPSRRSSRRSSTRQSRDLAGNITVDHVPQRQSSVRSKGEANGITSLGGADQRQSSTNQTSGSVRTTVMVNGAALSATQSRGPVNQNRGLTTAQILQAVDWTGGLLSIVGVTLLAVALILGGYPYTWSSPQVLAPLCAGVLVLVLFLAWEWKNRGPNNAMILNARLQRGPLRSLLLTLIITFVSGAQFFSLLMIWPSQAYNVYGHDPVGIGIRGLPFAAGVLSGCVAGLLLMSLLKRGANWLLLGASCLMTAGSGAMAAARTDNIHAVYGFLFLAGFGVGGIVIPASVMAQAMVQPDLIATVTSLTLSVRVVGGVIGYAVYFNVLVPRARRAIVEAVPAACVASGITSPQLIVEIAQLTGQSLVGRVREVVAGAPGAAPGAYEAILRAGQEAYARAYPMVYFVSIAFGGLAIVASLFMHDIDEELEDDHIAVVLQ